MLKWTQLPPLPDPEGFAGAFAGISNNALLVAGGANFPDKRPWEGGTKVWYDKVFVLPKPSGPWVQAPPLAHPLGYGVSATIGDSLLIAGGSDARIHHRDVFLLRWTGQTTTRTDLPPLPKPCANMSGALVGDTLYLAGGLETPTSADCLRAFWSLDTKHPEKGWQSLPPCPGEPRMLAVAGALGDTFYLFSGTSLHAGPDGKPTRTYLKDAWSYTPTKGWKQLADLPRAAVAAPSPAALWDDKFLLISGDDGELVNFKPLTDHPGFPRNTLAYDPQKNTWLNFGPAPLSRATAPTVEWKNTTLIPSGEARPGVRTPEVWSLSPNQR